MGLAEIDVGGGLFDGVDDGVAVTGREDGGKDLEAVGGEWAEVHFL